MSDVALNEETPPATRPTLDEYRKWLISAEQKAQDDFDKAVLSLSGGALGISFVFVKDIAGPGEILDAGMLLFAWFSWALSSLSILASYFFSHLALRKAIKQCGDGSIYSQTPGGIFSLLTGCLNALGAALFVAGVLSISAFAYSNMKDRRSIHGLQGGTAQTQRPIRPPAGYQPKESAQASTGR